MSFTALYMGALLLIAAAIGLIWYVLRGNERVWPRDAFQWTAVGISMIVIMLSAVMMLMTAAVQQSGGFATSAPGTGGVAGAGGAADVRPAEMNQPVPDFAFRAVSDDALMQFSDLQGKVVLVNVWATWCPPCRQEMPELNQLQQDLGQQDFVVLHLSDEAREDLQTYQEVLPLQTLSAYVDPESVPQPIRRNFAVRPTSFIIDREGVLRESVLGARDYETFKSMVEPYLEADA